MVKHITKELKPDRNEVLSNYEEYCKEEKGPEMVKVYGDQELDPEVCNNIWIPKFLHWYPQYTWDDIDAWIADWQNNGFMDVLLIIEDKLYIDHYAWGHWINGDPHPYNKKSPYRADRFMEY